MLLMKSLEIHGFFLYLPVESYLSLELLSEVWFSSHDSSHVTWPAPFQCAPVFPSGTPPITYNTHLTLKHIINCRGNAIIN